MDLLRTQLRILVGSFSRVLDDGLPSTESVESLLTGAERVHRLLAALVDTYPGIERNLPQIEFVISSLNDIAATGHSIPSSAFAVPHFHSGGRGRPRVVIPQEMVEYLIGNCFSVCQAAQLLQTSTSTLRRRMLDFGITVRSTYSTFDDRQLDSIVSEVQRHYPNCGYRLLRGHLAAMGHRVQESRIRDSLRRVDPIGVMSRWIHSIQRRTYSVPGPNMLWHIDGNHKLIQ